MEGNSISGAANRFLHPKPPKTVPSAGDREFLERFRALVVQHYPDTEFTTEAAAADVRLSRMHLNRKLRALTGQSTHEFIRTMRLEAARELLPLPLPVAQIARSVGFRSDSHFARAFRDKFGVTPSVYRAKPSLEK